MGLLPAALKRIVVLSKHRQFLFLLRGKGDKQLSYQKSLFFGQPTRVVQHFSYLRPSQESLRAAHFLPLEPYNKHPPAKRVDVYFCRQTVWLIRDQVVVRRHTAAVFQLTLRMGSPAFIRSILAGMTIP